MSSENIIRKLIIRANIGAQGPRKIVLDRRDNSKSWKAVKGSWDGSFKDNVKSGCGVVIEGVDKERWVTISKIAIPLEVGTAMAAEVGGVCVLSGMLDLTFCKCLCVKTSISVSTEISINDDIVRTEFDCASFVSRKLWACLWTALRATVDKRVLRLRSKFPELSGLHPLRASWSRAIDTDC